MRLAWTAILLASVAASHAQVGAPGSAAGGPAAGNVVSPGGTGAPAGPALEPKPRPQGSDLPPVGAPGEPPLDPAGPAPSAPGAPRTDDDAGAREADPDLGTGGTFDDLGTDEGSTFDDLGTGDGGTFDDLGTTDDEELGIGDTP